MRRGLIGEHVEFDVIDCRVRFENEFREGLWRALLWLHSMVMSMTLNDDVYHKLYRIVQAYLI